MYGTLCEDACPGGKSTPCNGHGTCDEGNTGSGACTCDAGHYGVDCVNLCPTKGTSPIPCTGHGTCDDGATGVGQCTCETGYYSPHCGEECPGGAATPCSGHGFCCEGAFGSGQCFCSAGYWGPDCGGECPGGAFTPCSTHGTCDNTGTCHCQSSPAGHWDAADCSKCQPGYYGPDCSGLCPHCGDGTCNDGTAGDGSCTCAASVYGPQCDSLCPGGKQAPCSGHGTCDDGSQGSGACTCDPGYYGPACGDACFPSPDDCCYGNGVVSDGADGDGSCTCNSGHWGPHCGYECPGGAAAPCSSHGSCDAGAGGSGTCTCSPGYHGLDCGGECPGGAASPCTGHGVCSVLGGGCTCHQSGDLGHWALEDCSACAPGYYGPTCTGVCPNCGDGYCGEGLAGDGACTCNANVYGGQCENICPGGKVNTCSGHGTCDAGATGSGTCTCESGFFGAACAGECLPSAGTPCNGHGVCQDGATGDGSCACDGGFYGPACGGECPGGPANICSGHGTCADSATGSGQCTCAAAYFGPSCASPCPGAPDAICSGHGTCNAGAEGDGTCACVSDDTAGHWSGADCSQCQRGWAGPSCAVKCPGCSKDRGTCADGLTGAGVCVCIAGTWGSKCQHDCPSTSQGVCSGHGTCSDGASGTGACTCDALWHSEDCSSQCPGVESGNPCSGHGTCADGASGDGDCVCDAGYGSADCSQPCPGLTLGVSACNGHGVCAQQPAPSCACDNVWYGPDCKEQCPGTNAGVACSGHGVCDSGATGSGLCTCDPFYAGEDCGTPCPGGTTNTTACSGHGACMQGSFGTGQCACDPGHWGPACETECPGGAALPCNGHGTCSDGAGDGTCLCYRDPVLGHWQGLGCDVCAAGAYGPGCTELCPTCERGSCSDGLDGTGQCQCPSGTWGVRCQQNCPGYASGLGACSGHGECDDGVAGAGTCECEPGFWGVQCGGVCPGLDGNATGTPCNGHGHCDDGVSGTGTCSCYAYRGPDCSRPCPGPSLDVCFGHGECGEDATCTCRPGYFGPDCSGACDCSGHGACHEGSGGTGACACDTGYFGAHCEGLCPGGPANVCSGHGVCLPCGSCLCGAGYWGPSCSNECPGGAANPCFGAGKCDDGAYGSGTCTCFQSATYGYFLGAACDQCKSGYWGPRCQQLCDDCNGRGQCSEGKTGDGRCTCDPGTYGANCQSECPGGHATPCYGHGACQDGRDGTGACMCQDHYFGPTCHCLCPTGPNGTVCGGHGSCDDGASGSGACACDAGYFGHACTETCPGPAHRPCHGNGACEGGTCACDAGFYGPDCGQACPTPLSTGTCEDEAACALPCAGPAHGSCSDGVNGTGQCTCRAGHYGPACAGVCPGGLLNVCSGHGTCADGAHGAGTCQCDVGWGGHGVLDCSDCASGYWGPNCEPGRPSPGDKCSGHGHLSCGVEGDGSCHCDHGWGGELCGVECPGGARNPCSGHGVCAADGKSCQCYPGYATADCSAECPGTTHSDSRRTISFWGGGGGVFSWNLAGCCASTYNSTLTSWHQGFMLHVRRRTVDGAYRHYASASEAGGMLFKADYVGGKTHGSGDFILPCGLYDHWGSDFVMRLTMGEVVDYFAPREDSFTLCDMLTSNINHLWSPQEAGPFVQPQYFTQLDYVLGGSAADVPRAHALSNGSGALVCHGRGICNDGAAGDGTCTYPGTENCVPNPNEPGGCSQQCLAGHYGAECTPCPDCGSHGTCNDGHAGDGTCRCAPSWWGAQCRGACTTCQGHGTCDDGAAGSGACRCDAGYKGRDCELECPGGAARPCSGNGECVLRLGADADAVALCLCPPAWFGDACQTAVPEPQDVCHHWPFTNTLFPTRTPGSPVLFFDATGATPSNFSDSAGGNSDPGARVVVLQDGQTLHGTVVDFNYLNGFTVMTWVKATDFANCDAGCPVFGRMHFAAPNFGDMGYLVSIQTVNGEPRWQFTTANGVHMSTSTLTYRRAPVTADHWYHVAVSFHRATLFHGTKLLCVDGQCETEQTDSGLIGYTIDSWFVLGGLYGDARTANIHVDELWICDRRYEASEIEDHWRHSRVKPYVRDMFPALGGPRGGLNVTLLGEGFDNTASHVFVVLGGMVIRPCCVSATSISFLTPEYDMSRFGPDDFWHDLPLRVTFGAVGTPGFEEAECRIGDGCQFRYLKQDKRAKTCHWWQFETADPTAGQQAATSLLLQRPDGFAGAPVASPYGPGAAGPHGPSAGDTRGLALNGPPYLFAENMHFNFADFTLAAWVKIPDFGACGNDGVAAGVRVCTVGGRFSPIGSSLSGDVNDWYAFGYLLTVSNSGGPDGQFYAQVRGQAVSQRWRMAFWGGRIGEGLGVVVGGDPWERTPPPFSPRGGTPRGGGFVSGWRELHVACVGGAGGSFLLYFSLPPPPPHPHPLTQPKHVRTHRGSECAVVRGR